MDALVEDTGSFGEAYRPRYTRKASWNYLHGTVLALGPTENELHTSSTKHTIPDMRNLILSAAATLILTIPALAQEKTNTATPTKITPTVQSPAQVDDLTAQKRTLSGELKNTLGMADGLLANANKIASAASEDDAARINKVVESVKSIQSDVTDQLNLVNKATEKDSKETFAKATEVNGSSMKMLEQLKSELMPESK